jgi:glycosyltransferase involved in cell wall biosynthesis
MSLRATIVIATKNRSHELRAALASAIQQVPAVDVLVMDDASTDGTAGMVRAEFPSVRLETSKVSQGYIVQRNLAARLADTPLIVSIDDDAIFPSRLTVAQTADEFNDPTVGVVAIPFIEPRKGACIAQLAPYRDACWVTDSFIGTAHALRRDLFLQAGGYRQQLVHQGEERDYSIRLLAGGYVVRLGTADPIHHLESPNRSTARMDYYGRRNDVLFAWHNVPSRWLLLHLAATSMNGVRCMARCRHPSQMLRGMLAGYIGIFRQWSERASVSPPVYKLSRVLRKNGPRSLESIRHLLPSPSRLQILDSLNKKGPVSPT